MGNVRNLPLVYFIIEANRNISSLVFLGRWKGSPAPYHPLPHPVSYCNGDVAQPNVTLISIVSQLYHRTPYLATHRVRLMVIKTDKQCQHCSQTEPRLFKIHINIFLFRKKTGESKIFAEKLSINK